MWLSRWISRTQRVSEPYRSFAHRRPSCTCTDDHLLCAAWTDGKATQTVNEFRLVDAEDEDFSCFANNQAGICRRSEGKKSWLFGYRMAGLLNRQRHTPGPITSSTPTKQAVHSLRLALRSVRQHFYMPTLANTFKRDMQPCLTWDYTSLRFTGKGQCGVARIHLGDSCIIFIAQAHSGSCQKLLQGSSCYRSAEIC